MAQQQYSGGTPLRFFIILFLLSYVMSSAPRYLRELKETKKEAIIPSTSTLKELLKAGRIYGLEPYKKIFQPFAPDFNLAKIFSFYH